MSILRQGDAVVSLLANKTEILLSQFLALHIDVREGSTPLLQCPVKPRLVK